MVVRARSRRGPRPVADTLQLALVALACGAMTAACKAGDPDSLTASPTDIEWGEVDFQQEMPTTGYDEQTINLTNESDEDVTVEIIELDLDHLCSPGIPSTPFEVGTLRPGQTLGVFVSVCDYRREDGERDSEQTGTVVFSSSAGGEAAVGWSFTPVEILTR